MSAKLARAARFRTPPHPPKPKLSVMPPLDARNRVVTIVKIELGRWKTERGKEVESREIRATRSDGKVHETHAVVTYAPGERKRMMEGLFDPEKALESGLATVDEVGRKVYDRRGRAVEKVLGLIAQRFGGLPKATELVDAA
jgi:hypothetical protein